MPESIRQAAVLAIREGLVCLVTSRTQSRWVIPKGHIEAGHTPQEAAEREAWEEAGLRGSVEPDAIGSYRYVKRDRRHAVMVFRMVVLVEHDLWPERLMRRRQWVTVEEAVRRVKNKGLRELLLTADLTSTVAAAE